MPRKKESKRNTDMQVLILPLDRMIWNQTAPVGYDGNTQTWSTVFIRRSLYKGPFFA